VKQPKTAKVVVINQSIMVDERGTPVNIRNKAEVEKWLLSQYGHFEDKLQKDGTIKPTFIGDSVEIADDGTIQQFSKNGLVASTKRTRDKNHNEMYSKLDELIRNAVFDHNEDADSRHTGLNGQKVYYSAARLGKKTYLVRLKLDISKYNSLKPAFKDFKVEREITA
jgi:hypothetical protein